MAVRIGIRELRENLARTLRRVQAGEAVEVTEHGRPVARIGPAVPAIEGLGQLVIQGRVRPPRGAGSRPLPADIPSTMTSEEAVDRLR